LTPDLLLGPQHEETSGDSHNLGGDLLVLGVDSGSQFPNNLRDVLLQLGNDLLRGDVTGRNAVEEVTGESLADNLRIANQLLGNAATLNELDPLVLAEVVPLEVLLVLGGLLGVLEHHGVEGDVVFGGLNGGHVADLLEPEHLEGSGDKPLNVVAEKVLVEFSVVDDGLDDEAATAATGDVASVGAAAPHVHVVSGKLRISRIVSNSLLYNPQLLTGRDLLA